jgi:hypothetical protein
MWTKPKAPPGIGSFRESLLCSYPDCACQWEVNFYERGFSVAQLAECGEFPVCKGNILFEDLITKHGKPHAAVTN